jgi:hypothetical protein
MEPSQSHTCRQRLWARASGSPRRPFRLDSHFWIQPRLPSQVFLREMLGARLRSFVAIGCLPIVCDPIAESATLPLHKYHWSRLYGRGGGVGRGLGVAATLGVGVGLGVGVAVAVAVGVGLAVGVGVGVATPEGDTRT